MEKLKMQTINMVDENIKKIGELFPNCLTETLDENGRPQTTIDFDQLRQELSKDIVEGPEERYQFTWPDKRNAIRLANAPTTDTLRPCREESVDFDNTQNLYIEGDNLQVLKLLRENYLGKVKMIYIDPPYNTGNDFVYNDDFTQSTGDYIHNSGQEDEEGNRLVANTESNGRFHTDWLNMIYPRLKVAKDLLSEDGIIFISIDDHEVDNLKKICDEVFGISNYISQCPRVAKRTSNKGTYFKPTKDYVLVYGRNIQAITWKFGVVNNIDIKDYKYEDAHGRYKKNGASLYQPSLDSRPNQRYYIECPDGSFIIPPGNVFPSEEKDGAMVKPLSNQDKCWRWSRDSYLEKKDLLMFTPASSTCPLIDSKGNPSKWNIYDKVYLDKKEGETLLPEDIIYDYVNSQGTKELLDINIPFPFAKPSELIKYLIKICLYDDDILILDFFSGSATTAHAVMQLNAEDGGKRKFIMVQLPEATDEKSEAYKAGYKNICEIGKERIRRAGKKIKEDSPLTTQDLDTGFRVLKLDSSNMTDVYYTPEEFCEQMLFENNIKGNRTEEDLLFQTMIDLGIELSVKIERTEIAGKTVWNVSDGYLLACFDENVNETTITEIAKQHPYYFVMRDKSLANDNVADNFEQIFNHYSKDTIRRIL